MALSLQETFIWGKLLGKGAFSEVVYVEEKATGQPYAMKIINKAAIKSKKDLNHLLEEIALQRKLAHPNIVRLYQVFESEKKVYLQVEYCSGGELFSRIVEKGFLTEGESTAIIKAVLQAVSYLHSLNIVHRDLKPENILLLHADNGALDGPENLSKAVKVSDFGFSKFASPDTLLRTQLGSLAYTAPEILKGEGYDNKVDIWSIGVICYVLLTGSFPFGNLSDGAMFDAIIRGKYSLEGEHFVGVSQQAKNFVAALMQSDPKLRPTADEALQHEWFSAASRELDVIDKTTAHNRFPTLPPQAITKARKVANDLKAAIDAQNHLKDMLLQRLNDALAAPAQPDQPTKMDVLLKGLSSHFGFLRNVQEASLGLRVVTPEPPMEAEAEAEGEETMIDTAGAGPKVE